jgi:hypothetical protein
MTSELVNSGDKYSPCPLEKRGEKTAGSLNLTFLKGDLGGFAISRESLRLQIISL